MMIFRRFTYSVFLSLLFFGLQAQITLDNTSETGYDGGNGVFGDAAVTFVVENTTSDAVLLTDLDAFWQTVNDGANVELLFSSTDLSGLPSLASTAWTSIATGGPISVPSNGVYSTFSNLTFLIPANTTYRFALRSSDGIRYSGSFSNTPTPSTITSSGISLHAGDFQIAGSDVGYGGSFTNPSNNPRWFTGSVTLMPATPCSGTPDAGFTVADNNPVCVNDVVNLSVDSATVAAGLSYQWQSSPDGTNWSDMTNDTTPSTSVVITDTTWFRLAISCGADTDISDPIRVDADGAPLSGAYTINQTQPSSATNFTSFTSFAQALICGGVSGPVTVDVQAGPYDERVEFPEVAGSSATNTITINGNGNILEYEAAGTNDRTTLTLDGTSHFIIDSLTIKAEGSTHGWVMHITNDAEHIEVKNCSIMASTTITGTFSAGIVVSGSPTSAITYGDNGSFISIENNYIEGGYYGVSMHGSGANNPQPGNKINNNIIVDQRFYGIYAQAQEGLEVIGNDISRPDRDNSTIYYGISLRNGMPDGVVSNNRIHNTHANLPGNTSTIYGLDLRTNTTSMSASTPLVVANNQIYDIQGEGLLYGIYTSNSQQSKLYHNTIVVDEPGLTENNETRMFYTTLASTGQAFKNNIVYMNRGTTDNQYFVWVNSATSDVEMDNNVYFTPNLIENNVFVGRFTTSNFDDLTDWQAANNGDYDNNSLFADPVFIGGAVPDRFRPNTGIIKAIGADLQALVPEDFEGDPRPANPDPGVYQFEPPQGVDMSVSDFISPISGCGDSVEVVIEVVNIGTDSADFINVEWSVNNNAQPSVAVSDSFFTGNTVPVSLGWFSVAPGQAYDISVNIDSVSPGPDIDLSNNTAELLNFRLGLADTITINQTAAPSITNYSSFEDLITDLDEFGVCGPLVVNVVPGTGPYVEQIQFSSYAGVDSVNTITINGNGNTLTHTASGSADRITLSFSGASYIALDSLVVEAAGSTHGWVIHLTNNSEYIDIRNCSIIADTDITSAVSSGIVASNSNTLATSLGVNASNVTIENNYIEGGYYAIAMNGEGINTTQSGNKILNNTIVDQRYYGIYVRAQEGMDVIGNDISRPNRDNSTIYYGLTAQSGMPNGRIMNNRVHNTHANIPGNTSTFYAFDFRTNSTAMDVSTPLIVANNQAYDLQGEGLFYGIFASNSQHTKFYHNTIVIDEPSLTENNLTNMIYTTLDATGQEIKNNIAYMNRGTTGEQYLIRVNSATSAVDIDHNAFYAPNLSDANVFVGRFTTTEFDELSDWQSANNGDYDNNSVFIDPAFIGGVVPDRLRPSTGALKAVGQDVQALVSEDFDGVPRPTNPDLGAYQFDPLPCTGVFNTEIDTIFPGGAFVSWESDSSITQWQVEWDTCGFVPGSGLGNIDSTVTTNQGYELENLPRGECICVFVREVCDPVTNDLGPWSNAIEICVPVENDIEMLALLSPQNNDCGQDSTPVSVQVINHGVLDASGFDIVVEISGDVTDIISTTFTGTLPSGADDSIFVGNISALQGGNVDVTAYVDWVADSNNVNDTIHLNLDILRAGPLEIFSSVDVICGVQDVMFYTEPDQSSPNLQWLDANDNVLGTGDSITVSQIDSAFTIRLLPDTALSGIGSFFVGPTDSTIGAAGFFTNMSAQSMEVTAYDDVTILNAVVYVDGPGDLHVEVTDVATNAVIDTFTVNVNPTNPNGRVRIPMNIELAPGDYELGGNTSLSTVQMLRNSSGAVYPYGDPNIFEITGNTFSSDYYYFYYDMEVQFGACDREENERTLPLGESAVADFEFDQQSHTVAFFNTSVNADSIVWDFAGLGTSTDDTVSFQFPETDSFTVCLIAYSECGADTICETVWAENVSVEDHSLAGSLKVFPNPNSGDFELSFDQPFTSEVTIELLDLSGRSIWMDKQDEFSGPYNHRFSRSDLSSGTYLLRINNHDGMITKRVIITKE